jgi:hypothetical protein
VTTGTPRDVGRIVELIAAVVAPVTVLTGLLAHIGSVRNRAYYGHLGVDQNLLQLSVQDLVLRSADVTFGALARLLAVALALVALDQLLAATARRGNARHHLITVLAAAGVVLAVAGLLLAVGVGPASGPTPLLGALLLGTGTVIAFRFGRARAAARPPGPIPTAALVTALLLALFWAATLYAQDLGRRAATDVDEGRAPLPVVGVYSDEYLDLPGRNITASAAPVPAGGEVYRYSGLRLLTYANERWFLITEPRSEQYRSRVVVLRDTEDVRIEVVAPV